MPDETAAITGSRDCLQGWPGFEALDVDLPLKIQAGCML
jgi:hypothetical protein